VSHQPEIARFESAGDHDMSLLHESDEINSLYSCADRR
jgi:hypothetical protein